MVQVIGQHAVVEHAVGGHRAVVRHGQWWLSAEKEENRTETECNPSVSTLTRRATCIMVDDEKKMKKILTQYDYYSLVVAAVAAVAGWHWYH